MADIRGIELASEIYGLEDTSARNTATAASQTATTASETATAASQSVNSLQEVVPSSASPDNKLATKSDISSECVRKETLIATPYKPKTITLTGGQIIRVSAFYYDGLCEECFITYNIVASKATKTDVFTAVSPGHSITINGSTVTFASTGQDTIIFIVEYLK